MCLVFGLSGCVVFVHVFFFSYCLSVCIETAIFPYRKQVKRNNGLNCVDFSMFSISLAQRKILIACYCCVLLLSTSPIVWRTKCTASRLFLVRAFSRAHIHIYFHFNHFTAFRRHLFGILRCNYTSNQELKIDGEGKRLNNNNKNEW